MHNRSKSCQFVVDTACLNDLMSNRKPLYEIDGKQIFCNEILDHLHNSNIRRGDVIMLHSDVLGMGRPDLRLFGSFLESIISIFISAIGPSGTLVMPTFTWSFPNNEIFDKEQTPSKVGALTEYFRQRKGSVRTADPLHSCAILGPNADVLLEIDNDTFGANSINRHLFDLDAKLVTFGLPFRSTLYHYAEQLFRVPYRLEKTFSGIIVNEGVQSAANCTFFARDLERDVVTDTTTFENQLVTDGLMTRINVGNSHITTIDAKVFVEEILRALKKNVFCLLKYPPKTGGE